ncbi:hypothetical protein [Natrinema ejinorense]|uniref:Uncharacterized protein n=1 Tax=Natrinema ejinorense TaxID=373386 RepID=A0A2A5QRA0_9EURY|nr:hypothetical protein [Natrinema ejinorense]PCR89342.1 hypothetical protein CP557_01585 [Natrinema ejinorense]
MANVLTLEQYRQWVNDYLDAIEEATEEEQVVVTGDLEGDVNVWSPSEKYDSKRIDGSLGYPSELWSVRGTMPLRDVIAGSIERDRLLGSAIVPRRTISTTAEEIIEEQQGDLESARGESA